MRRKLVDLNRCAPLTTEALAEFFLRYKRIGSEQDAETRYRLTQNLRHDFFRTHGKDFFAYLAAAKRRRSARDRDDFLPGGATPEIGVS